MVGLGGALRGLVAYALVLQAVPDNVVQQKPNDQLLVTTVLTVVLCHTVLGGAVFPLVLSNLAETGAAVTVPLTRELTWTESAVARFDERFLQPWFGVQGWQDDEDGSIALTAPAQ